MQYCGSARPAEGDLQNGSGRPGPYRSVRSCACSFPQRDHRARKCVFRVTLIVLGFLGIHGLPPGKKANGTNVRYNELDKPVAIARRRAEGDGSEQRNARPKGHGSRLRMSVEFLCLCCEAATAAPPARLRAKETEMAMQLGHVHIKTRDDPQKVAKFYIDNFGATVKRETPGRGCQLDLHGVQLNVTTINADQNHEQHVGIEHIAIETDDYPGAVANLKKNGAQVLEERFNNGRHVCWVAAPDGAQMELIEKV